MISRQLYLAVLFSFNVFCLQKNFEIPSNINEFCRILARLDGKPVPPFIADRFIAIVNNTVEPQTLEMDNGTAYIFEEEPIFDKETNEQKGKNLFDNHLFYRLFLPYEGSNAQPHLNVTASHSVKGIRDVSVNMTPEYPFLLQVLEQIFRQTKNNENKFICL